VSARTTALVTGGAGLIGSHIVDGALAAGWDVRILNYLAWIREQGAIADYFAAAERVLRRRRVVKRAVTPAPGATS